MKRALLVLLALSVAPSWAAVEGTLFSGVSHRTLRRAGVYATALGDPLALTGINLAYHMTDFLRLSAGVGVASLNSLYGDSYVFGAGVKLVVPSWNFTPVIGANLSHFRSQRGGYGEGILNYENFGLGYTSAGGFHTAVGVNTLFAWVAGRSYTVSGALPYINLGYFFESL